MNLGNADHRQRQLELERERQLQLRRNNADESKIPRARATSFGHRSNRVWENI